MNNVADINITTDFIDFFALNKNVINQGFPDNINSYREKSMAEFQNQGIPYKSERFKYTRLEPLFAQQYKNLIEPKKIQVDIKDVFKCDVPDLDTDVLLLVNGFYDQTNKLQGFQPSGVWIGNLQKAFIDIPEVVKNHFAKYCKYEDGLIALNSALFRDGFMVYVPKNVQLEKPLQIIKLLISDEDIMVHQRNLVILEENSSANLVICNHTLSSNKFLSNSVTEIYVGENAQYTQLRLQNEHNESAQIASYFIQQEKNSVVKTHTITLHGGMIRNAMNINLNGEGCENHTYGLYLTDQKQHVDNQIFINHSKPNCTSNQLFKGVLDDESTGAFSGRILVSRDAQKTKAYQKNNNLLLSDTARMNTRPQLEIYADDVKCSHGATVGQLNAESLFYLRSRGIGYEEARLLLMFAFANEITELIPVEAIRNRINLMVNQRLRGELSRCHNCPMNCC